MEESPYWEADIWLAAKEISPFLCIPKVYQRLRKSCHWTLSWVKWLHSTPWHIYFFKVHYNNILPLLLRDFHLQVFRLNICMLSSSPPCTQGLLYVGYFMTELCKWQSCPNTACGVGNLLCSGNTASRFTNLSCFIFTTKFCTITHSVSY